MIAFVLFATIVIADQNSWVGGPVSTCSVDDASCYNACPVLEYDFDNQFCVADDNMLFKYPAGLRIKGIFRNLDEHTVKGPGQAGGWDNDPDIIDIDGDGDLDLVVSDESFAPDNLDSVWIFLNDGTGTFSQVNLGTLPSADELSEVDADNDGDVDIFVTGSAYDYGEDLVLFVQIDPRNWQKCVICADVAGDCTDADGNEREAEGVFAGDVDGDGDIDVVVSHLEEGSLYWFERVPAGTPGSTGCTMGSNDYYFIKHPIYPNTQGDEGWNVWLEDMDGDGDLDIITTLGSLVAIYWNPGDGDFDYRDTLLAPEIRGSGDPIRNYYGLAVGDLDEDGDPDIAVTMPDRDTVKIFRNDGNRQFTVVYSEWIPTPMGIVMGDVDNDGDLDMYVASYIDGSTTLDSTIYAIINHGSNSFYLYSTTVPGRSYFGTGVGDLDGDENADLLVRAGTYGESTSNREGLYWYSSVVDYPDSSVLISKVVDINGSSDIRSWRLNQVDVEGDSLQYVDVYVRLGRNLTDLRSRNWVNIEDISTCTFIGGGYTLKRCIFNLPIEDTLTEFIQYKLVLKSVNIDPDSYNDFSPMVNLVKFYFDNSITPVGIGESISAFPQTFQVFDVRGKFIGKMSLNALKGLKPGIYMIRWKNPHGWNIRKVIIR